MATIRRPDRGLVRSLALLALLSEVLALPARAQVPGRVNFQGLLLDSAGQPLTGTVSLQLQLFAAASGGSALWTETHASVSVTNGIYDVVLGSLTPLTPALFSASPRYLQVTVNGQVLSPRREFVAVPFALKAETANSATTAGTATTAASAGFGPTRATRPAPTAPRRRTRRLTWEAYRPTSWRRRTSTATSTATAS
jgi:hypothetical protein